jgi:hypothetical protein
MGRYVGNAFSLGMLDGGQRHMIDVLPLSVYEAQDWAAEGFVSVVGHADTALLLTELLGQEVKMNRIGLSLEPGDQLLVGQYNGPRLPEGATSLPEGATVRWYLLNV